MGNLSGTVAALSTVFRPRTLIPSLRVQDIRALDWKAFKRRGINGVVVDKDNCLTKPLRDELAPDLKDAWESCLRTFGPSRVLVVSNSAGTVDDPSLIQAEAVSRELGVPVLVHRAKKPSRRCALDVARYFSPRPEKSSYPPVPVVSSSTLRGARVAWNEGERTRLLAIGDRLTTDIILASRIRDLLDSPGPFWRRLWTSASSSGKGKAKATEEDAEGQDRVVSVLTDRLLAKERAGTRLMRWMEERMLRYGYWVEAKRLQRRRRLDTSTTGTDAPRTPTATTNAWRDCLLEQPALPPAPPAPSSSSLPAASPTSLPLASSLASLPSYLLSSLRTTATRLGRAGIHRLGGAGVELGKRVSKWYEGGYGLGVREPDGWRRLAAWKRMRIGRD